MGYTTISAAKISQETCDNGVIIDVRTRDEHQTKRLGFAHIHIPMDEITPEILEGKYNLTKDTCLNILCLGGRRAEMVAAKLCSYGYCNVNVIEGGLIACEKCGHPIEN